jgi:hypothetical protein
MSNNVGVVIAAANTLIAEHVGKRSLWQALREGVTMRLGVAMASAELMCPPDPGLIEKTRLVVQNNIARLELFDGECWGEIWRSVPSVRGYFCNGKTTRGTTIPWPSPTRATNFDEERIRNREIRSP